MAIILKEISPATMNTLFYIGNDLWEFCTPETLQNMGLSLGRVFREGAGICTTIHKRQWMRFPTTTEALFTILAHLSSSIPRTSSPFIKNENPLTKVRLGTNNSNWMEYTRVFKRFRDIRRKLCRFQNSSLNASLPPDLY